jgi:hypothetical protein
MVEFNLSKWNFRFQSTKNKQVVAILAIIMTIVLDLVHFASVNHL